MAHHVSDLVEGLDLTAFYAPYEPRMMVKVLLYANATGVFSSRGIARKLEEDVAFRVLGAGNCPQHRTICEFRRRHLDDFKELFVAVVGLAPELGLARFGKLSVDGTKVRANASKRKAMSYGRMQEEERRLAGEIGALLRSADETDVAEDAQLGPAVRGDELPAALRRRERSSGGDPGGEGAFGGGAAGGGRRPRTAAGAGAEPEGWPAVHASVWGA